MAVYITIENSVFVKHSRRLPKTESPPAPFVTLEGHAAPRNHICFVFIYLFVGDVIEYTNRLRTRA